MLTSGVTSVAARVADSTLEDFSPRIFFIFAPFSPNCHFQTDSAVCPFLCISFPHLLILGIGSGILQCRVTSHSAKCTVLFLTSIIAPPAANVGTPIIAS